MKKFILFNGRIVKDCIETHTGSSFFSYGNGFFETALFQNQKLYFWADHLERMERAAEQFEFALNKDKFSRELVYQLIGKNLCLKNTLRVKVLCTPLKNEKVWDIIVSLKEYDRIDKEYSLFIHWEPRDGFFCNFKSMNYQALSYWKNYYKDHFHADEVLFRGFNNNVLEAGSSNILLVKDHTLFYIDSHNNYLAGIMQKNIIKEYKECGFKEVFPVKNGFTQDHLENADEILLSNSLIIAQRASIVRTAWKEQKLVCKNHGWAERIRDYFLS